MYVMMCCAHHYVLLIGCDHVSISRACRCVLSMEAVPHQIVHRILIPRKFCRQCDSFERAVKFAPCNFDYARLGLGPFLTLSTCAILYRRSWRLISILHKKFMTSCLCFVSSFPSFFFLFIYNVKTGVLLVRRQQFKITAFSNQTI